MKRIAAIMTMAILGLMFSHRANAQLITFDEQNFLQSIISYIQDGDNMAQNANQFLQNLGLIEEQLDNMKKWNERYRKVSTYLSKGQQAIYTVNNYEYTIRLFKEYVKRLREMEKPSYYDVRNAANESWYYLLLSSREVKKVRQALDSSSEMSEAERLKVLEESNRKMSAINVQMTKEVQEELSALRDINMMTACAKSLEEAVKH